jgi:signal transduction histidine kinase
LLGEAQVLKQQRRSLDEYDVYVGSVQEEMRRLAQVVNSLLTLARAHAGFPLPAVASVSANELVVEAVQRCEPLARPRVIRLVPELAMPEFDAPEPTIEGDGELLCTMLMNLLRNAVRYSYARGTVEIHVGQHNGQAIITVADRGPGIAPEHISSLFNRFYHVPKNGVSGSGLGLAIAKAVVELHHGSIEAKNRDGGGCEFIVTLPLATPELVGVA